MDKEQVVILAQDEGRFGRISTTYHSWAPPGLRPLHSRQVVREYFYVFAAVCPSLGQLTALLLPSCNSTMMSLFLLEVSNAYKDKEVIMQLDGAGWHWAKDLQVPANIHFIFQPAYSPELNPVEHIWDDIREKHFCNVFCNDLEQAMDLAMQGIERLQKHPHYLASLTGFPHLLYPMDC